MASRLRQATRLGHRSGAAAVTLIAFAAAVASSCEAPASLTRLIEARRLNAALHVAFSRSIEAGNRAVMAVDDGAAAAAAAEARESMAAVDQHRADLQQVLQALAYDDDRARLDAFGQRFDEYRRLTDEVLTLVVENTNVKAQRLAFGPGAEAAGQFRAALDAAAASAGGDKCNAREQAARGWAAVAEIRALQPRHIQEAEDEPMSRMEAEMTALAAAARAAVDGLSRCLPSMASPLADGRAALDRFMTVHAEIVDLSRRNSNVRALALALGRRRTLAAEAEVELDSLEKALAAHEFRATR